MEGEEEEEEEETSLIKLRMKRTPPWELRASLCPINHVIVDACPARH